jgi:hypothetical protein
MSINNIYCNSKVYKELYKKGRNEELHSNPDNLAFYFFNKEISGLDFDIIKKQSFMTIFGQAELAIIGSSHYFKLENHFTEILTCSTKQADNTELIYTAKNRENFQFKTSFNELLYTVSVRSTEYTSIEEFISFEQELLKKQNMLLHVFEQKSAITALHYLNTDKQFLLQTWHTYPEYRKVIFSESLLLKIES